MLGIDLKLILPKAIAWAEEHARQAAGALLGADGLAIARSVGVGAPEAIKLVLCDELPMPTDPVLRQAAEMTGLLGPDMAGLTLGQTIFVKRRCLSRRLLAHECRHVFQVEHAGGLAPFLAEYLRQLLEFGYRDAPFEVDARAWEAHAVSYVGNQIAP